MALFPPTPDDVASLKVADGRRGLLLRLVRDQRMAFLLVGGVNTGLGLVWFVVFHLTIGVRMGYMVTLLCAHVAAVICAFLLHRTFVFKVRGHFLLDLARFELVNLTALSINAALLPVAVELVGLAVLPAQLLVTMVTVVLSFFAHREFSFRRHRRGSEERRLDGES